MRACVRIGVLDHVLSLIIICMNMCTCTHKVCMPRYIQPNKYISSSTHKPVPLKQIVMNNRTITLFDPTDIH